MSGSLQSIPLSPVGSVIGDASVSWQTKPQETLKTHCLAFSQSRNVSWMRRDNEL